MAYDERFEVHELHELKLLEHVEQTERLNNRQVSRILGVSIKLAHETLKGMVQRGLLHVQKRHARRWDYFLTPAGIVEKARLTMEFLDFSMHFYREARRRGAQVCRELAERGTRRIAFLGAGDLAEITYLGVREWGLELAAVYADDAKQQFMGVPVQPVSALPQDRAEAIIICAYDPKYPMQQGFLPAGVEQQPKMWWVFRGLAPRVVAAAPPPAAR